MTYGLCENHIHLEAIWTARDKDGKVHEFCGPCFKEWASKHYPKVKAQRRTEK